MVRCFVSYFLLRKLILMAITSDPKKTPKRVTSPAQSDQVFNHRLKSGEETLKKQFYSLYENQGMVEDHFADLLKVLRQGYSKRPDNLKKSDIKREKDKYWFLAEKWVGMMLYSDLFAGDLNGVRKNLDYLEELGINLVHLMPLLKSPKKNNDGGYAVSDYRDINPELGTLDDFKALIKDLHDRDMIVMIDFVLNHTADEHEWAMKARQGNKEYQDRYYFHQDRTVVNLFEQSLPEVFPTTAPGNYTFIEEVNKWVMTVFNTYQWDLNYTNPKVFIEMVDVMIFLSNLGIDILRLDALAFMWKKMGTDSQNLDEAHLVIKAMKSCMRIVAPGTLFLAEAIVAPYEIVKYFGEGDELTDECEMAYNATFMVTLWDAMATKNNRLTLTTLSQIPPKPFGTTWLNYVRCHDDIGLGYEDTHAQWSGYDPTSHRKFLTEFLSGSHEYSFSKGQKFMENEKTGDARICGSLASLAGLEKAVDEKDAEQIEFACRRIKMLHSLILSYGGIPMLYSGDELGTLNDYSYLKDSAKADDSRWMHRPRMNWKRAEKRKKKETLENRIFTDLTTLIRTRKSSPEMAALNNRQLANLENQHLLGIFRSSGEHSSLVVCNLNDHSESFKGELISMYGFDLRQNFTDKLTSKTFQLEAGHIVLEPYETVWLTQKPQPH